MANTYTQIHLHFVFAVKYRGAIIDKTWKENLYRYITMMNGMFLRIWFDFNAYHIQLWLCPEQVYAAPTGRCGVVIGFSTNISPLRDYYMLFPTWNPKPETRNYIFSNSQPVTRNS